MSNNSENDLKFWNKLLLREPNNIDAVKGRAIEKYRLEDFQGALDDWNRADEIEPNNADTIHKRSQTKYALNDYKGALEDLNRADEIEPNNPFTLKNRGDTKLILNDYEGALEDLNRADEIQPNDLFTLQARGETKRMLCDYQGALEDLNRADEIQPNNVFTLYHRGKTKQKLDDRQGAIDDYEEALKDLNKADEVKPNDAIILHTRGIIKLMLGDYQGALEDLNRAIEIEPNRTVTLQLHIISRCWIDNLANALDNTTQASKHPNNIEAMEWKSKIEEKIKQINSVVTTGVIQVPFSELKVIKTLGEGGFGEVSLAKWRGIKVALKKLKSNVDDMSHEAKTLMQLRYKHIVLFMDITTDPATYNTILIMEYMKHGSLEDLLFKQHVKLSRASVIRLALDIALGVNYLHSHKPKVLHRDLKSANVLTRAKIADFGTAKFLHTNVQAKTVIGNNSIGVPPEMLAEEIYDEKVDIFAFGVILYEMLTNKRLSSLDEIHRMKRIRENITDTEMRQLVLDCCTTDPTKRPYMNDIIELLRKMKKELK